MQLDQRASLTAPPDACLGDEILGAEQHRTRQRTDPLVERYIDRIEKRAYVGKGLRRIELARLPQPGAVQVQLHAALARKRRERLQLVPRRKTAADLARRQLDQQRREALVTSREIARQRRPVAQAQQYRVEMVQSGIGTLLMELEMRRRVHRDAEMTGALAPDAQRDQLRHRAAHHECRCRLTQKRGNLCLERFDQFAVGVAIGMPSLRVAPFGDARELGARRLRGMAGNVQRTAAPQRLLLARGERHRV